MTGVVSLYNSIESYCCQFEVDVAVGLWCHTLKFYVKVFYVMGKALSGKLSCTGIGLVLENMEVSSYIRKLFSPFAKRGNFSGKDFFMPFSPFSG